MDEYIAKAAAKGLRIRYVVETHLHADFVSGHRELAERTGAEIVIGARAGALFPHRAVADGDEVRDRTVVLRFLETPGHTPESLSVLVIDTERSPEPRMVLTGDTLFIGDVGRPDLVGIRGLTPSTWPGCCTTRCTRSCSPFPTRWRFIPRTARARCAGKNISKETWSTIGEQRRTNHALQPMSRDAFIEKMTADLPEQPRYFGMDVEINRRGASALDGREPPPALDAAGVRGAGERRGGGRRRAVRASSSGPGTSRDR